MSNDNSSDHLNMQDAQDSLEKGVFHDQDTPQLENDTDIRPLESNYRKYWRWFKKIIIPLIIVIVGFGGLAIIIASFWLTTETFTESLRVVNGAVATDSPRCSTVGRKILEQGGNAIDSAIASALCLGVLRPFASGIGGGGFMMIHLANGTNEFIDFREVAPLAATADMYESDPNGSLRGGKAVGVPGEIRGFYEAHRLYGKLKWEELFKPSIEFAKGFEVGELLAKNLKNHEKTILADPGLAEVFAPQGKILQQGEICKREKLAYTLSKVAQEGPNAFYEGEIAKNLVSDIRAHNGIITEDDLKMYTVKRRPTITSFYHGLKIVGGAPPASSAVVALILNILEAFDIRELKNTNGLTYHYIVEAMKHAFAHRAVLGDPLYAENVTSLVQDMLDKLYAEKLRTKISAETTFPPENYIVKEFSDINDHGTSHLSVIDKERNAVALTTTVNYGFGAKIASQKTGIVLNNQMDDFTVSLNRSNGFGYPPSLANIIAPGKTPMSSMSPLFLLDGDRIVLSIGGSGGPTIISAVAQTILNFRDFKMDPKAAIDKQRMHHQLYPNIVSIENGWSGSITDEIVNKGHSISVTGSLKDGLEFIGCVQAVAFDGEQLLAASDWRKLGKPDGY